MRETAVHNVGVQKRKQFSVEKTVLWLNALFVVRGTGKFKAHPQSPWLAAFWWKKSAVRIDDNGLRIFYKKDTLILLFTIVIIILNMFNIGNTQNLTWAAIISFIKGKKNNIFELLRRKRTVTSFEARGLFL